jgi:hypothetical protein
LARETQKKYDFLSLPGVQNNIVSIASSVHLEQGNLLSQRAPFFLQHSASGHHHERHINVSSVLHKFESYKYEFRKFIIIKMHGGVLRGPQKKSFPKITAYTFLVLKLL